MLPDISKFHGFGVKNHEISTATVFQPSWLESTTNKIKMRLTKFDGKRIPSWLVLVGAKFGFSCAGMHGKAWVPSFVLFRLSPC